MTRSAATEVILQRAYYAETADRYDALHISGDGEHDLAMHLMFGFMNFVGARSLLDVGSGTGRIPLEAKRALDGVKVIGIEPSDALRQQGYKKGLGIEELIDGDAQKLPYADGSFDVVCEFGALHHIPDPGKAVSEMLRVSRKGIFISDCNNFGQGSFVKRSFKQLLNAVHAWRIVDLIKTRGKGYTLSEGDGLAYSYSVYNQYAQVRRSCKSVHVVNLDGSGIAAYYGAAHVALMGIK